MTMTSYRRYRLFLSAAERVDEFAREVVYWQHGAGDLDNPQHPARALHFAGMNYLDAATASYEAKPAKPAPAPRKERRAEYPLDSLLRRLYTYRRTMRILLERVEDAGGSGTREGCKLAVLMNRTYIDASDSYWRLRRQLDSIPLPF